MDFQILDNGTAIATAEPGVNNPDGSFTDVPLPSGSPVPTWTVTDASGNDASASVQLQPAADGLSCVIAPANPPVDGTGFVAHVTVAFPDGSKASGDSDPFDIVKPKPSEPNVFRIALSNPAQSGGTASAASRPVSL